MIFINSGTVCYFLFFHSVSKCFSILKQMDINMDNLSSKVDSAVMKLKKKYETMCDLYQKFQR